MFVALLSIAMVVVPEAMNVKQFSPAPKTLVPRALIESELCPDPDGKDCWLIFEETGKVWVGDVNGDGADELLIYPGLGFTGSGGDWYFLYQRQGGNWVSLISTDSEKGWQIQDPRSDILPVVRNAYHDLRLSADGCLKWNGSQYELYEPGDYHQLRAEFFDASNPQEAEIFWRIRYEGQKTIQFEPQWFPLQTAWRKPLIELADPQNGLTWVSRPKGGVYGIQVDRAFLLVPRRSYLGAERLELQGDWLLIYDDSGGDQSPAQPSARYNRLTQQLELLPIEKE